ncbi:hypothetical protein, partial [Leclercia sp.]|uniref:hypothetical protein n=1 Tax=Leclercia sp. TaxID=1898428 RepID=UPI0028AA381E
DWLLMVISGNNLMINFMAAMFLWQAFKLVMEKYSSPFNRRLLPGAQVYHHQAPPVHIARYLIITLSPIPYQG